MGDSSESDEVSTRLTLVCSAAVVACSLVLLVTNSSLVGDGPYYLLRAIQNGGPIQVAGRQGINSVREAPLLLALHLGVTNTHALTVFQGVGFVIFPALVWILAIVLARHSRVRFTLVTISCGLCFGTLIFFSVDELTPTLPLVVLASVLLTQPTPWSAPSAVLAMVSTGLLFFSHEAVVPCAVLLIASALVRITARLGRTDTAASAVVLALSVAVLGGALWTLVFWPNPSSHTFFNLSASSVLLSIGALFILGWVALHGRMAGMEWLRWSLLAVALPFIVFGIWLAIIDGPNAAYSSRATGLSVAAALQLALLVDWVLRRSDQARYSIMPSTSATRVATAFLVAVMIIPTVCALRWSTVIADFRSTITQRTGVIPAADIRTTPESYLWSWTNPTLSLVLRSSSNNAVVQNPTTNSFNPFSIDTAQRQILSEYRWGK